MSYIRSESEEEMCRLLINARAFRIDDDMEIDELAAIACDAAFSLRRSGDLQLKERYRDRLERAVKVLLRKVGA